MAVWRWAERDKRTGEVVICERQEGDDGAGIAPTKRTRMSSHEAKMLGAQLIAASDEDLTGYVEASREVVDVGVEAVRTAQNVADIFKRAKKLLG